MQQQLVSKHHKKQTVRVCLRVLGVYVAILLNGKEAGCRMSQKQPLPLPPPLLTYIHVCVSLYYLHAYVFGLLDRGGWT